METDAALVASLARDLDGTFPALVQTHQDRLYTIALRLLGDPRDAEEVASDALVRAYRAIAGYPRERIAALQLTAWLASIAVNLSRNRRRRLEDRRPPLALEPLLADGFDPPAPQIGRPDAAAERRDEQRMLAEALLRLPEPVRAAVVLRHVTGLSVAETALALDRPEGTIKAQVSRGLASLREILEPAAALSPAAAGADATPAAVAAELARGVRRASLRLQPALEANR